MDRYDSAVLSWMLVPKGRTDDVTSFHYHIAIPRVDEDGPALTKEASKFLKLADERFEKHIVFVSGSTVHVVLWVGCLRDPNSYSRVLFDDTQLRMAEAIKELEYAIFRRRAAKPS